jgi:hypothetical protein
MLRGRALNSSVNEHNLSLISVMEPEVVEEAAENRTRGDIIRRLYYVPRVDEKRVNVLPKVQS